MNIEDYEKLMLKHAQIQTSMLGVILMCVITHSADKLGKEVAIEMLDKYNEHCDELDDETCKALETTQEC